jgi:hypothetical protein
LAYAVEAQMLQADIVDDGLKDVAVFDRGVFLSQCGRAADPDPLREALHSLGQNT